MATSRKSTHKLGTAYTNLSIQVELEAAEIKQAPIVPSAGLLLRCHFCGGITHEGTEIRGPISQQGAQVSQFKGRCCGG